MRQITKKAIEKFLAHERWQSGNTRVNTSTDRNMSYLELHGNVIANHNETTRELNITTAGWNTLTTRERLNGIPDVQVYTKAGQLYLNGTAWNGDWKTVWLAAIIPGWPGITPEEHQASMTLFHAAPDLLEALKAVMACNKELGAISKPIGDEALAAIAKAEGTP